MLLLTLNLWPGPVVKAASINAPASELRSEIGFYLGFGRDSDDWSDDDEATILSIETSGLRQFYGAFDWPFLYRTANFVAWSTVHSDGAGTLPSTFLGELLLTASTDTFYPSMEGKEITNGIGANPVSLTGTVTVKQYVSAVTLRVVGSYADLLDFNAGDIPLHSWTLTADGNYMLPEDFGCLVGDEIALAAGTYARDYTMPVVPVSQILALRQRETAMTGRPIYCAVRPMYSDGSAQQRWELMVWPIPDTPYTLELTYKMAPGRLTLSNPHPFGGPFLAELILECCLSVAENRLNDERGVHWERYQELKAEAIKLVGKMGPTHFGPNLDPSIRRGRYRNVRGYDASLVSEMIVGGVTYPS